MQDPWQHGANWIGSSSLELALLTFERSRLPSVPTHFFRGPGCFPNKDTINKAGFAGGRAQFGCLGVSFWFPFGAGIGYRPPGNLPAAQATKVDAPKTPGEKARAKQAERLGGFGGWSYLCVCV